VGVVDVSTGIFVLIVERDVLLDINSPQCNLCVGKPIIHNLSIRVFLFLSGISS
jgi:hypothetical protein